MVEAALLARVVLAIVLAVAGLSKLRRQAATTEAAVGLGVPEPLAPIIGWSLGPVELGLAAGLLMPGTGLAASVLSAGILVVFSIAIAVALRRPSPPACNCFGATSSDPLDRRALIRNGALVALAAVAIAGGDADVVTWVEARIADAGLARTLALVVVLLVVQAVVSGVLLSRRGVAPESTSAHAAGSGHGLPIGVKAPAFVLPSVDRTGDVSLEDLLDPGRPVLLFSMASDCEPCRALLPELAAWQQALRGEVTIVVAAAGGPEANRTKAAEYELDHVLLQHGSEVDLAYEVPGTPAAVLIDPDGRIASPVSAGAPDIRTLVHSILETNGAPVEGPTPSRPLYTGDPAPTLYLRDPAGGPVDLRQSLGKIVIVVFWSPTCSYCEALRNDLRAWDADREAQAVELLLVTPEAEDPAIGTVALDPDGTTAAAFGSTGTPSAVLVDAQGRIASDLAVGGPEVLALARRASRLGALALRFGPS